MDRYAARAHPQSLGGAAVSLTTEEVVYRSVDGLDLGLYLVRPAAPADSSPGVLFLHGGAWRSGHQFSFLPHCHYFASRGIVAASASYRLIGDGATDVRDCIADAQAAIRWLRELEGVDTARIVAAGYSAGGHLAATAGLLPPVERHSTSSKPNAMVLLNPVTQVVRPGDHEVIEELSPVAHVAPGAPPTLIMYGTRDFLKPLIAKFGEAMQAAGNRCDMVAMDGAHTVVHAPIRKRDAYIAAVRPIDDFLVSLGMLKSGVDVGEYVEAMDPFEILGGRSEMSDPRKTRPRRTRPE
jgi:acetyl esterase